MPALQARKAAALAEGVLGRDAAGAVKFGAEDLPDCWCRWSDAALNSRGQMPICL